MMPPLSIQTCPSCGHEKTYVPLFDQWMCLNDDCDEDAVFPLAAYEADQRAKAEYLDSLDNARVDDDDESVEDDW